MSVCAVVAQESYSLVPCRLKISREVYGRALRGQKAMRTVFPPFPASFLQRYLGRWLHSIPARNGWRLDCSLRKAATPSTHRKIRTPMRHLVHPAASSTGHPLKAPFQLLQAPRCPVSKANRLLPAHAPHTPTRRFHRDAGGL